MQSNDYFNKENKQKTFGTNLKQEIVATAHGMIRISFRTADCIAEMDVSKSVPLRDLQKPLCTAFRQRFPAMKADLVIRGKRWDCFHQMPLVDCEHGEEIEIIFEPTDDPYFYDVADRRGPKETLETLQEEEDWKEQSDHASLERKVHLCSPFSEDTTPVQK